MKTLYFDLSMGAAGDMLAAALFQLVPEPERVLAQIKGLGLPGVEVRLAPAEKCGIQGLHYEVLVHGQEEQEHHQHHGHHLHDIEAILAGSSLPEAVREDALAVYQLLAQAESKVHGCTVEDGCLIGMGAILLNGCVIGAGSLVAAGALVTQNTVIPSGSLVMGAPAKAIRPLRPEEAAKLTESAQTYHALSAGQLPLCGGPTAGGVP